MTDDDDMEVGLEEMIGKRIIGLEVDSIEETLTVILDDDTALEIGGDRMYLKFMHLEEGNLH